MIDIESRVRQIAESDLALADVVEELRRLKNEGAEKQTVYACLERLRAKAGVDEARILEIMDFVFGFCAPHNQIW